MLETILFGYLCDWTQAVILFIVFALVIFNCASFLVRVSFSRIIIFLFCLTSANIRTYILYIHVLLIGICK